MKNLLKTLTIGAVLAAGSVIPTFAQDDPCLPVYQKFLDNWKGDDEKKKIAIAAGEELVQKCSANPDYAAQIKYVEPKIKPLKEGIRFRSAVARFEASIADPKNPNADETFAAGKELIAIDPNLIDVMIVMATVGYEKSIANPPVDKYNADTISVAKQVIQKIESGTTSKQYGVLGIIYQNDKFKDGKSNTLGNMNYFIGEIMYNRQNMKKEAIPYFYKAVQYNSGVKSNPFPFKAIGDFYIDEFNRLDDERTKIAEEAKKLAGDDPKKKELGDKAKELLAMQKGYAERMIEGYARAYNLAGTDKAYKDSIYNTLKLLYNVRFDGKKDGMDAYISSFSTKPLTDPAAAVAPVAETPVVATTPVTTTTTTTTSTVKQTPEVTKGTTKTVETTTSASGAVTTTTTKKTTTTTTTKKPAPKKKGTR